MMISNLPLELQNKIFFYATEHPCAKMIKEQRDYILNKSGSWAKQCIDKYGCLHNVFEWYDYKILRNRHINLRWWYLLTELGGIINIHTNNGLEPIEFEKLLEHTTRLKINDAEKNG